MEMQPEEDVDVPMICRDSYIEAPNGVGTEATVTVKCLVRRRKKKKPHTGTDHGGSSRQRKGKRSLKTEGEMEMPKEPDEPTAGE